MADELLKANQTAEIPWRESNNCYRIWADSTTDTEALAEAISQAVSKEPDNG